MKQVAKCLVCGDPIEKLPNVECKVCETPHHTECWNSIGGCSTFGCENQANKCEIIPVEDRKKIVKKQWIRTGLVLLGLWGADLAIFVWNKVKQLTSFVWDKTKLLPWAIIYPILGFLPEDKLKGWLSNPFYARFSAGIVDFVLGMALFVYVVNTEFFPLYIATPILCYIIAVSIIFNFFRNAIAFGEINKIGE